MDINPISVVTVVLDLVKAEFPLFSSTSKPTEEERLLAKDLLKQLYNSLTEYTFMEETVLEGTLKAA